MDLICADEAISRWYGQGGHWINLGLTVYVAIDRNPENGAEIYNSTCGKSGIMIRLRIMKYVKNEEDQKYDRYNLSHGKKVLKELVMP